jgi:glycosyltransferase involved in cell wall biosynthesis
MSDATNNTDKITIIIPAYNESSAIGEVVSSISKTMAATKHVYEIVVVDDGSGDDTASVAERAGATVIRHILNTGSGGATATGLSYAYQSGSTIAATMDADGQHDPGDVVNGINLMSKGGADLLIGSRLIDAAGMSTLKIIGNKGLSLITYLLELTLLTHNLVSEFFPVMRFIASNGRRAGTNFVLKCFGGQNNLRSLLMSIL